jgi:hypothetical protein
MDARHMILIAPFLILLGFGFAIIAILPYFKIYPRLGYNKWLSLLMLVPLANLILLYVVAFSEARAPLGTTTHQGN